MTHIVGSAQQYDPNRTDDETCIEAFSRFMSSASFTPTSGDLRTVFFTAPRNLTASTVSVVCGATAAATVTLIRFGIYTVSGSTCTLAASTANDTTLLGATNTVYNKSLSASYAIVRGELYCVGLLSVATTPGTYRGVSTIWNSATSFTPRLGGNLAGQTDLPASFATGSLSSQGNVPWVRLS